MGRPCALTRDKRVGRQAAAVERISNEVKLRVENNAIVIVIQVPSFHRMSSYDKFLIFMYSVGYIVATLWLWLNEAPCKIGLQL